MIIISGPCQHEEYKMSLDIARNLSKICQELDFDYYFKASFDKANRTSKEGERGLGYNQTMTAFTMMKDKIPGLKIVSDFHTEVQIENLKDWKGVIDVIQIPAFLSRQTDLLEAAIKTGLTVNVKKGQFAAPWDVAGIISKTGQENVWITDRGTSFGYNTLVTDFTGLQYMRKEYDTPIIFDATHSVQKPGGNGTSSGGNRDYVPGLVRAAVAQGIDGLFIECHPDPDNAKSDGPNSVNLKNMKKILQDVKKIQEVL